MAFFVAIQTAAALNYTVSPGQSIQEAIDKAKAGDRVQVLPGVYHESLSLSTGGVTLSGLSYEGERATLDGQNELEWALRVTASDTIVEGFGIHNYTDEGVSASDVSNVIFRNLVVRDTGRFGVMAEGCREVTVDGCVIGGAAGPAIEIRGCATITISNNEVYKSAVGISIENSLKAQIENNSAHHNSAGMVLYGLPGGHTKEMAYCKIVYNRIWGNNYANASAKGSKAHFVPPGLGVLISAADEVEVTQNVIEDNGAYGVAVMSYANSPWGRGAEGELDIEPNSDNTYVHHNRYANNGANPSARFKELFPDIPSGDLYWDKKGRRNQWQEVGADTLKSHPERLVRESGAVHTNVMNFI